MEDLYTRRSWLAELGRGILIFGVAVIACFALSVLPLFFGDW